MKNFKRFIATLLVATTSLTSLPLTAQAGIVPTDAVLPQSAAAVHRERVSSFLARDDVRQALQAQGVSPQAATERVQAMSDNEVEQLAGRIDQAPAGGDVLGVLFTVFIVLLVTDIMGLTKVFPFTRSVR
ncbi:MAG: PA2779 family protein [Burkholderiales bacterium]|nr:PA2779 family protein [Burkholderiales bacterium]